MLQYPDTGVLCLYMAKVTLFSLVSSIGIMVTWYLGWAWNLFVLCLNIMKKYYLEKLSFVAHDERRHMVNYAQSALITFLNCIMEPVENIGFDQ